MWLFPCLAFISRLNLVSWLGLCTLGCALTSGFASKISWTCLSLASAFWICFALCTHAEFVPELNCEECVLVSMEISGEDYSGFGKPQIKPLPHLWCVRMWAGSRYLSYWLVFPFKLYWRAKLGADFHLVGLLPNGHVAAAWLLDLDCKTPERYRKLLLLIST